MIVYVSSMAFKVHIVPKGTF